MSDETRGFDTVERHHRRVDKLLNDASRKAKRDERYAGSKTTGDLAQEAAANIATRKPEIFTPGNMSEDDLRRYLNAVVKNTIRDEKHRARALKRPPRAAAIALEDATIPCDDVGTERMIERRDLIDRLNAILQRIECTRGPGLGKKDRRILVAMFREALVGKTQDEIADRFDVDRSVVSRNLEFMKAYLEARFHDD